MTDPIPPDDAESQKMANAEAREDRTVQHQQPDPQVVADVVYGRTGAIVATTTMVVVFVGLWYLLPLYRRMRN
jgi:hypothetical protein